METICTRRIQQPLSRRLVLECGQITRLQQEFERFVVLIKINKNLRTESALGLRPPSSRQRGEPARAAGARAHSPLDARAVRAALPRRAGPRRLGPGAAPSAQRGRAAAGQQVVEAVRAGLVLALPAARVELVLRRRTGGRGAARPRVPVGRAGAAQRAVGEVEEGAAAAAARAAERGAAGGRGRAAGALGARLGVGRRRRRRGQRRRLVRAPGALGRGPEGRAQGRGRCGGQSGSRQATAQAGRPRPRRGRRVQRGRVEAEVGREAGAAAAHALRGLPDLHPQGIGRPLLLRLDPGHARIHPRAARGPAPAAAPPPPRPEPRRGAHGRTDGRACAAGRPAGGRLPSGSRARRGATRAGRTGGSGLSGRLTRRGAGEGAAVAAFHSGQAERPSERAAGRPRGRAQAPRAPGSAGGPPPSAGPQSRSRRSLRDPAAAAAAAAKRHTRRRQDAGEGGGAAASAPMRGGEGAGRGGTTASLAGAGTLVRTRGRFQILTRHRRHGNRACALGLSSGCRGRTQRLVGWICDCDGLTGWPRRRVS